MIIKLVTGDNNNFKLPSHYNSLTYKIYDDIK